MNDFPTPIVVEPRSYDCTPSSLLASAPCTACYSESELMAALLAILIVKQGTTVAAALHDSACFACLTKKQMLQGLVTILGNQLLGAGTVGEVSALVNCLRCVDQKHIAGAILKLLCSFEITVTAA